MSFGVVNLWGEVDDDPYSNPAIRLFVFIELSTIKRGHDDNITVFDVIIKVGT